MFTGIVTDIGIIREAEHRGDLRLVIGVTQPLDTVAIGASIACSGTCLTVVEKGADWFAVDVSQETLSRTAPGMWAAGRRLNIERSLRVGDELGGHIVSGHVDGVGEVVAVEPVGDSHRVALRVPADLSPYVAPKGSIALDGVSLTVNAVGDEPGGAAVIELNIIPHSWDVTTLADWRVGSAVNVEIDTLARYLHRMRAVLG